VRIPAPIYAIDRELRYIENHRGIPLLIRIFVDAMRWAAFFVVVLPLVAATYGLRDTPFAFFPSFGVIVAWFLFQAAYTTFDIFFPLGWRLFRWIVAQ